MAGEDRILTPDEMWDDAPNKYDKPSYTGSRGTGLYKKSLKALEKERERNKIRKEYPSLTDELADELIEKRKRNKGMLDWSEDLQRAVMTDELKKAHPEYTDEQIAEKVDYELGGTEMEIEDETPPAVDVPEMETEVVDLPEENENEKEIVIDRKDETIVDPDKTLAEEVTPDLPEGEDITVIDNDPEDDPDIVTDEEVAAPDKQKKPTEPKQEEEKQEKPNTDETEPKQEEKKTGYDRYPTGVRVGEDILGEVNTVAGGVKDVAEKIGQEGTNSGSIANEVARSVPHYDYRSLFR